MWRLYAVPSGGGGADEDCRAPRGAVPPLHRCRVYFRRKKVKVLVSQSCPTLCDPMDCSSPGSSVHGIFQNTRVVAISYSRGSFRPRDRNCISCAGRLILDFINSATWEAHMRHLRCQGVVTQSCPTLCDPMDYSLPGSSVHGIFQARVLEWGAITFSKAEAPEFKSRVGLLLAL